jgi:uroporphyrinogen decarboxylase
MQMNGKERVLQALRRSQPDIVPVFEWFIDGSVGEAVAGSADPVDIAQKLDLDGVNVRADYQREFLDETTTIDEWQIKRQLTGDILPAVLDSPITDILKHREYQFPDPAAPHRFATLEKAVERVGDEKAVVLNLRDGFSDMRDLLGYEGALTDLLLEPQAFHELLERSVEYNLQLAAVAKERYGTQIVATTDDVANATGMLMRPETYMEMIGPHFQDVIQGYRELGYLCIKHCDGNIDAVVDFWIECGIDCLDPIDPGAGYTMADMRARYGDKICLKGNIDCTGALCDGTPDEVEEEVRQCILGGGANGGLILSSSNTIHRGVKPENFLAMIDAARRHGTYPPA